ncbi:UNVERIFIED_CONTAM: putative disease resistance protein RGA1 [Sesamum angustifolium]|uniref:Disease resistance protein RGA1 n=1 Tax=Sesamum angustifolium TaxID=2727405 RepID=A0AAW2NZX3_9LAMI
MAETLLIGATVKVLVDKLLAVATEEIGLTLGVKNELTKLNKSFAMVQAFLNDAARRQVEEEAVNLWLKNLESISYEVDNLLDQFNYEIIRRKVEIRNQMNRKVRFFFSSANPLLFRSRISQKIMDVNMRLKMVNEEAISYGLQRRVGDSAIFIPPVIETDSISVDPIVLGRENDASVIVNMLVDSSDEVVSVVPIVGMGGLGKTTLARLIFNDQRTKKHFDERIWVCVSEKIGSTMRLFKKMLDSLTDNVVQVESRESILRKIKEKLEDKRYLLVLDDLWNDEKTYWEDFKSSLLGINSIRGNFVIVTTRSKDVASTVNRRYQHSMGKLYDDDCWDIIKMRASSKEEEVSKDLETIGKKIACRCGGLPLAANVIGGTLQGKVLDDWISILQSGFSYSNEDASGVLQKAVKDKYGDIKDSEMHDLVHDLACSISKAESFNVESCNIVNIPGRVKYLVTKSLSGHEYSEKIENEDVGYLRTLFLDDQISDSVFRYWKNLRTLELQCIYIEELTPSVAKLIHLRFLDVSFTSIRAFPETICKLYNLQTLRAIGCIRLKELPSQLQNLVSLRHLVTKRNKRFQMPLDIGKLTCLRTLKFYNVGHENGCRVEELGYLKNLKGKLKIRNLEHVNDKEEAARARLYEKPNVHNLELVWNCSRESNNLSDEQVLEGLEPHSNIKSLTIKRFCGHNFPSWIMNATVGEVNRLDKLVELKLIDCEQCVEVPTLGHLPMLKILKLKGLRNVRLIGPWFYYPPSGINELGRSDRPPFPSLERFILKDMTNLAYWIDIFTNNGSKVVNPFPRLEFLKIRNCPNMSIIPDHDFPSLKKLEIDGVETGGLLLDKICGNNLSSLTDLSLEDVSDLTYLPERLLYDNRHLTYLRIIACPSLTHLELLRHNLQSLEQIYISSCNKLKSLRILIGGDDDVSVSSLRELTVASCQELTYFSSTMLESCTSLVWLSVSNCHNLVSFPVESCRRMPHLHFLRVSGCPSLRSFTKGDINCLSRLIGLAIGPFSETEGFATLCEIIEGIQQIQSIKTLKLYGWPQFDSLPDQLQHLTTLSFLQLYNFNIEILPEWFGNLSSLECLVLTSCKRLWHFPSKEAMQRLTKLQRLFIRGCPFLSEGCKPDKTSPADDSEWHKISHIPFIIA